MSKKNNINKRYKGNGTGNYYSFGSGFSNAFKVDSSALGAGVANAGLGMASNLVGGIASNTIAGGLSSGAGNAISGLSSIASAIPGPWGAVAGAGLQVIGGLVNRAFGSKLNEQTIAETKNATSQIANYDYNSSSFDELAGKMQSAPANVGFTKSDIGSDGWFSNKAKRKYQELLAKRNAAIAKAEQTADNATSNLIEDQSSGMLRNSLAFGGQLLSHGAEWDNGFTYIGNGDTHENNPNEGVQMGVDNEGVPNLVEEGEVVYNDYVFSNRLKADGGLLDTVNLPNRYKKKTFADVAKKLAKESEERPNDPISKRGFDDSMMKLQMAQEYVRAKKQAGQEGKKYSHGGKMGRIYDQLDNGNPFLVKPSGDSFFDWLNTSEATEPAPSALTPIQQIAKDKGVQIKKDDPLSFTPPTRTVVGTNTDEDGSSKWKFNAEDFRFAPVLGAATALGQSLLSKPDYSGAERLENYIANNPVQQVVAPAISQKMAYNPLDPNRLINQQRASNTANRRALMTVARNNPAAAMDALLKQGYSENVAAGEAYRNAMEYNRGLEEKVLGFNRATDMTNAESSLKAQIANQEARQKATALGAELTSKGVAMRDAIDARRASAISTNMSNFFDNLGNVGIDIANRNDRDRYIRSVAGRLSEKPMGWSDKDWKEYNADMDAVYAKWHHANGGKLNKKKRKGLTY